MGFELTATDRSDHLLLTVSGEYKFERLFGLIEQIKIEADKAGRRKVIVDCRKIEGTMTEADRFQGGQHIAQVLGSRIHAALVMPPGQITKLGEIAAVNRGAVVLVTDSMDEAIAWLLD